MKSYTDIEQSKKLAEILPIESVDMIFPLGEDKYADTIRVPLTKKHWERMMPNINPCWSLSALIEQLPNDLVINGCSSVLWMGKKQVCYYRRDDDTSVFEYLSKGDNLLDVVVEMIIKLKEDNLI